MSRASKHIKNMQHNQENYAARKRALIKEALECGVDVSKVWVDDREGLAVLFQDQSVFRSGDIQSLPIPLSDKTIAALIAMPKKRIGQPIMINNKQKVVHGIYLQGSYRGHRVIFALSIVRNSQERFKYMDFSIKLDVLVSGMEWMPLVRLDSLEAGAGHPNYIKDGKVVDEENLRYIHGPHIHTNSEATQVLTDDLSYMCAAETTQNLKNKFATQDRMFFRRALETVMRECGIPNSVLRRHDKDDQYLFDFRKYLFRNEDMEM